MTLLNSSYMVVMISLMNPICNEQTYQSIVIWLRIMNRQVARIQTMAITVAGESLPLTARFSVQAGQSPDKAQTKPGQSPDKVRTAAFPTSGSGLETALAR